MVKISVIIATYNAGEYIKRALTSICSNHYPSIECIVIDGVSKDNTLNIVKQFESKLDLKYVSEPDKGIFDALNKGVMLASGDYVYVLGADDELIDSSFVDLINNSNNEDVVYGKVIDRNSKGDFYYPKAKSYKMLSINMPFSHQGMIMKKSVIIDLKGFNIIYKISADFDLLQRAYLKKYSFKYVETYVAYFSTSGISRTSIFDVDKEVRQICIKNGVYKYFSFRHIYHMARKLMKVCYLSIKK